MAGISSSGLISGLNTDQLITQLMTIERQPEAILKQKQTDYQAKIAALLDLQTKLGSFKSSLDALSDPAKFNTKQASVTKTSAGAAVLTASASAGAALGSYTVEVDQLAQASAVASQGWADKNTTPIATGTGSFTYKVGSTGASTTISVNQKMTLQGLRDAINMPGSGVYASIVNNGTGSSPYRLMLTATSAGSGNSVLITQNDTNLDFTNKKIGTAYAYTSNSYSGNVYANSGNYYTGTDNKSFIAKVTTAGGTTGVLASRAKYEYSTDGGINWSSEITAGTGGADATADIVIDSTNKTLYKDGAPITLSEGTYTGSDLATELQSKLGAGFAVSYDGGTRKFTITNNDPTNDATFNWSNGGSTAAGVLGFDTVDATVVKAGGSGVSNFDAGMFIEGGKLANSDNGRIKINFGTSGTLAIGDKFSIDAFNPEIQAAQDAVIKVGNSTIVKNSNTISDAIEGVTLNLTGAAASSPVTVTVSGNTDDAKKSIQAFTDAYNTMADFLNTQLSYDPTAKTANPLLGDPTLLEIRSKIARVVTGSIPGLGTSSYTNLSQIGITSNAITGKLSLDDSKVASALAANPDSVSKLFVSTATATNQAVSFVSKTAKTQTGTYSVYVDTAPQKATLLGGQTIASSGISADETLAFQYADDKTAASPFYTNFSVKLSAGAGVNSIVNTLNSAFATHNVGLTASNESGKVRIISTSYGADQYFKITSDKGNIAGQIGFNDDGTSENTGADIAGTINGHVAKGVGNQLTSKSGLAEDGLTIAVDSTQTGGFGSVTVSSGIADKLPASLATYTSSSNGVLKSRSDSMQKSIDDIDAQIQRMEDRFTREEQDLRDRFTRLETLLQQYNTTSQFLSMQLGTLSGSTTSNTAANTANNTSNNASNNSSA